jgi:hypothetical protein
MTNDPESCTSAKSHSPGDSRGGLLKLGAVAVASALVGGIAAAWWYRKTILKLHETGENSNNSHFGIASDQTPEETTEED